MNIKDIRAMLIARQIEGVDSAIDTAVYGLYGLTDAEIKTVEGRE